LAWWLEWPSTTRKTRPRAEILEELHKPPGVEHAGVNLAPECSLAVERADGADLLALPAGGDHRGLSFHAVGSSKVGLGTESCLVEEKDRRAQAFGSFAQLRIGVPYPLPGLPLDHVRKRGAAAFAA